MGKDTFIVVKGRCNLSCLFCGHSNSSPQADTARHRRELRQEVDGLSRREVDRVVWGAEDYEPTTFPHLPEMIARARDRGFSEQELNTNAMRTADIRYLRKLKGCGLTQLNISLFEYDARSADVLCGGRRVLERKLRTIANCRELGMTVFGHVFLMRANYRRLPELLDLHAGPGTPISRFWISAIYQSAEDLTRAFLAPFSGILQVLDETLPRWPRLDFGIKDVPRCLARKHLRPLANARFLDGSKGTFAAACAACALRKDCCGLPPLYPAIYGEDELSTDKVVHNPISLGALQKRMSQHRAAQMRHA